MSLFSSVPNALSVGDTCPGSTARPVGSSSEPITAEDLRQKVVLVDFWTYPCINWLRTLGYVRAWAEKYEIMG